MRQMMMTMHVRKIDLGEPMTDGGEERAGRSRTAVGDMHD